MSSGDTIKLAGAMANASSYAAWSEAAQAHDIASGADLWKSNDESKQFGYQSIRKRLDRLSELWRAQDNKGLLYALNEGIHGNMDGMGNKGLYRKAKFGTKELIQDYVDAVVNSLNYLAGDKVDDISFEDKIDFFRRAQHCYGRSAFLMSGSGSFLYYHFGVAKALWEQGILPRIISGSSGGSIAGAMICTHTDEQLAELFDLDALLKKASVSDKPDFGKGVLPIPIEKIQQLLTELIPDLTFQESYELTGRHLNISIAPAEQHQTSRLLNAIASPNVYIREAVLASCAIPGIYPPVELAAKDHNGNRVPYLSDRKWVDGSVTNDLPTKRLARLYGVNHHIVSQANPLATGIFQSGDGQWGALSAIRSATNTTAKAWINAAASFWRGPLSYFPQVKAATNIALSVINQDYTGDINIVRPPVYWSPNKMISELPRKDIDYLVELGQKTAWPKVEMIRVQTKISQALEKILSDFEHEMVEDHQARFALKGNLG